MSNFIGDVDDAKQEVQRLLKMLRLINCRHEEFWPALEHLAVTGTRLLWAYQGQMQEDDRESLHIGLEYVEHLLSQARFAGHESYCTQEFLTLKSLLMGFFQDIWKQVNVQELNDLSA